MLTAPGERDAAVRDAERRAGQALLTMTDDEGMSLREAVDWCGGPGLTVRDVSRLRRLRMTRRVAAADERATRPPALAIRSAIRAATGWPRIT